MKIVIWTRDNFPDDLELDDEGNWMFEDRPAWWNLEVGDQIQFVSFIGEGTRCYFVTDVWPYQDEFDGYTGHNLVRMEE